MIYVQYDSIEHKKLAQERRLITQDELINRLSSVHGDTYDLSKTRIANKDEKNRVIAICKRHGEFSINMYNFLNGQGCGKCAKEKRGRSKEITLDECISRCKNSHGDEYAYDFSAYHGSHSKLRIYCKEHGWFLQEAAKHWMGQGCKLCKKEVHDTKSFIDKSLKKFPNASVDYGMVDYVNSHHKVDLLCRKCGKYFSMTPNDYLNCHSCPRCNISSLEKEVETTLLNNNICFDAQYTNTKLRRLRLDFFIDSINVGIECQGRQHFRQYSFFGGENGFKSIKERDARKKRICDEIGIKLLYFSHCDEHLFLGEEVIKDANKLIDIITEIRNDQKGKKAKVK